MSLLGLVRHAVDSYWADDVQILGAWEDERAAICLVYRRTIDPSFTFGRREEFYPGAADGTLEGFARDIALNLAEPIGALAFNSRQDQYGVIWVAIAEDIPIPTVPVEITSLLGA